VNQTNVNRLRERPAGIPVVAALAALLEKDGYLLRVDANERSITHRLALHLQTQFPEFDVDCEYNRDGIEPKRIKYFNLPLGLEDTEAKTVFPDILVHKRGTNRNYLVIELKKDTNTVTREFDFAKLGGYMRDLGYEFALFIELTTGEYPDVSDVKWVDV
jgi:hypothetical protein